MFQIFFSHVLSGRVCFLCFSLNFSRVIGARPARIDLSAHVPHLIAVLWRRARISLYTGFQRKSFFFLVPSAPLTDPNNSRLSSDE